MKKLLSVASARPNFVKLAAVDHALRGARGEFEHVIVHTGQHYDPLFSDVFFEELGIALPQENLGIHGLGREEMIEETAEAMEPVLAKHRPDAVLVYGDVNGAVGAARAAKKASVKLIHVEAGLRSFDSSMPEEHNRIAIDETADLLLCSEQSGMENLAAEGVKGEAVLVGNTMIDTLLRMLPTIEKQKLPEDLPSTYVVTTLHRPSNVDDGKTLAAVFDFLGEVAAHVPLLLPVHHRLQASIDTFGLQAKLHPAITLLAPQPYLPFLKLTKESAFIITDSGGIQEEATVLGKRCFTLRRNTERPATIASGSNVLINPEEAADRRSVLEYAAHPAPIAVTIPPLWDGQTGRRIVQLLSTFLA